LAKRQPVEVVPVYCFDPRFTSDSVPQY
jgi:hypothetical protein